MFKELMRGKYLTKGLVLMKIKEANYTMAK